MRFEERYKLQVPIEQGERGTLWNGQDTKLARKVVVAVVEADAPEALRARFSEQMEKLAKLRHANLVRVLEVGRTDDEAPYAALEVTEGDTLEKRLREGPPMRVDHAVRMMADLCGALSALHGAGIAHGDVHPGNVIVRELGGRLSPKLRRVGLNGAEQRKGDEEGGDLNALAYMAPAQARGEVLADAASDVYSTAAMVFSALTGRLPHRGASIEAIRRAIVERAAPAAADVRPELAGPIAEVLDTALSPDPERRFATADALAKALRTALIRTRNPGALQTVVGPRTLEADDSDEQLAAQRLTKAPANAPGAKAAAASVPRPGAPRPAPVKPKEPSAESPSAPVVAKAAPPAEAKPAPAARRDESLEFERLSGLLEVAEPAAPPPPPPSAADPGKSADGKAKANESLEFERLSGLLEIPKAPEPPPPPPPSEASPAASSEASAPADPGSEAAEGEARETTPESAAEVEPPKVSSPVDAATEDRPATPKEPATKAPSSPSAPRRQPSPEVFEAEEIAAARSGMPGWVWAVMGIGAAAAIVVAVVLAASGGEEGVETALIEPRASSAMEGAAAETREEEVAAEPVTEPAAPAAPVEPPVEEPPAPEPIRLTLTNVPEGATITVDGAAVEGTELELAPSEGSRTVAVQLEGHEEWTQSVPGDSSAELRVELRPVPAVEEPREERRVERRRTRRVSRGRPDRARPSRARPNRRESAAPSKRRGSRRGSRPSAISDPGF